MTTFTKNQAVYRISNWDRKGAFAITTATVHSCGKKQMVLNCVATGECLGRNYSPTVEQWDGEVRADLTAEQAEARALELAAKFIAGEITRWTYMIELNEGKERASYIEGLKQHVAEMQAATPTFIWR
jgi:hypothetical protein